MFFNHTSQLKEIVRCPVFFYKRYDTFIEGNRTSNFELTYEAISSFANTIQWNASASRTCSTHPKEYGNPRAIINIIAFSRFEQSSTDPLQNLNVIVHLIDTTAIVLERIPLHASRNSAKIQKFPSNFIVFILSNAHSISSTVKLSLMIFPYSWQFDNKWIATVDILRQASSVVFFIFFNELSHWGRLTQICFSKMSLV